MTQQTFRNPILPNGADPWIIKHTDGYYYLTVTLGDRIALWRSHTMTGLAAANPTTIWTPEQDGPYSYHLWAPELHYIEDRWYIYYTANDGGGDDTRRICVLELIGDDPVNDEWIFRGVINTEHPGLDGTVLQHEGELYFFYSGYGFFPDYGSAIYAVRMVNPWTLTGPNVLLSAPTEAWEKQGGMAINEGPVFLKRNGRLFLVFSASATWSDDYSLGMITISETDDVLDASAWTKHAGPVFAKNPAQGVYAPGHNSFTVSPDGSEDWIVYHAYSYSEAEQQRSAGGPRSTRIQRFGWKEDGLPDFGLPISEHSLLPLPSGE
ncbi:alpha-N-arabinofuranosidase [Paenibacillus glucanolyticus]|uniref:Alpha-N-arabinofuranosidase n=2 Tax=Paenibacillus glucanolyticus TaxID=59843 RepID=A0A163D8D9_9BACL|nr:MULTISPECIES: glycoside hydrolase family 43 protein [Paenibacillus]AWP27289.1 alpha-N-arabinofuranosidase [Paenibacillus sp. Cedars]KZS43062.1 alpha-N-arabinofuranosidase [Paenibacillus glucanolyticus]MDH6670690.1 GH43 family beta-xylosidase [Paenibacillus sp. LBL]